MSIVNFCRILRLRKLKKTIIFSLICIFLIFMLHIIYMEKSFDYLDSVKKSGNEEGIGSPSPLKHFLSTLSHKASEVMQSNLTANVNLVDSKNESQYRKRQVVKAMKHSWKAYKDFAWGQDELYPLTNGSSVWMGTALTMIDSLDLLLIMNLTDEFQQCVAWIKDNLHFDLDKNHVNVFETTIRVLGGLLSAYDLSKEEILLQKAIDLGERLLVAYNTNSGIPYSDINLKQRKPSNPEWTSSASTAEAYSVILELYELSRISKNQSFANAAKKIVELFLQLPKNNGLVPIYIDPQTGKFDSSIITLGARGDSYYEYLLKYWIQTGKTDRRLYREYVTAVEGISTLLVRKSHPNNLVYVAELIPTINHKMDHLACFVPAMLALGVMHGMNSDHLVLAEQLAYTCYQMYAQMPTGLSPEIVYFNQNPLIKKDIIVKSHDKFNGQRPETIESFFYLYRITKNKKYQEWGWEIFQSFEKYSKVPWGGYVSIGDVLDVHNVQQKTKCESYWFSETLKYLYLLFTDDDSLLSLKDFVFNTEGHPFPIIKETPGNHT